MVVMFVVSSPAFGSVTAKQTRFSPRMSGGSMRAFCSPVPATTTGLRPKMLRCTADAPLKAAPDSAMACIITDASVMPRPAPPYSSGIAMPSQPPSTTAPEELLRKRPVTVALVPVLRPEVLAEAPDRLADGALLLAQRDPRPVRGHRRRHVAHSSVSLVDAAPAAEIIALCR